MERKILKSCGDIRLYQRFYEDDIQVIANIYDLEGTLFDQMSVWCVICCLQFSKQDGKRCIISFKKHNQRDVRKFLRIFDDFNLGWRFIPVKDNKEDTIVNFSVAKNNQSWIVLL